MPIKKFLFLVAIVGIFARSDAETLSFPAFRLEVQDGWMHFPENGAQARSDFGELISISHPDQNGILRIQHFNAPDIVTRKILRNMTNVGSSTPLSWQNWGDFSGYQYSYSEARSFYRQWWLVNERTVLLIVYESNSEFEDIEIEQINKIVKSITANPVATI